MSRPTTRIMARRAWDRCWDWGWLESQDQWDAGHKLLRGHSMKSIKAVNQCEDALVGYARKLGYRGATSWQRRNMGSILAWLVARLKEVDWISLAKLILPIILALIG